MTAIPSICVSNQITFGPKLTINPTTSTNDSKDFLPSIENKMAFLSMPLDKLDPNELSCKMNEIFKMFESSAKVAILKTPGDIAIAKTGYLPNGEAAKLYADLMTGSTEQIEKAMALINQYAKSAGLETASIQKHYEAKSKGEYINVSVPAINGRIFTHLMVYAALEAVRKNGVSSDQPIIFELAKSESAYTGQPPAKFAALVKLGYLMAGVKNQNIYLQGDHFQVDKVKFWKELDLAGFPGAKAKLSMDEIEQLEEQRASMSPGEKNLYLQKVQQFLEKSPAVQDIVKLCKTAIQAGYRNIDLDSSVLERETGTSYLKQEWNGTVAAYLTYKIRQLEKEMKLKEPISIGGEVGEIGKADTTKEDILTYMGILKNQLASWQPSLLGVSKLALTTGTAHGGVRDAAGKLLRNVPIRFDIHQNFAAIPNPWIRGATRMVTVQHGASTLDPQLYKGFAAVGVGEVHLATEYQTIILETIKEKDMALYSVMVENLMNDTTISAVKSQKAKYKNYLTTDRAKFLADKDTLKSLAGVPENIKLLANLKPELYAEIMNRLIKTFDSQFVNLRLSKGNEPLTVEEKALANSVISTNKIVASSTKIKLTATED